MAVLNVHAKRHSYKAGSMRLWVCIGRAGLLDGAVNGEILDRSALNCVERSGALTCTGDIHEKRVELSVESPFIMIGVVAEHRSHAADISSQLCTESVTTGVDKLAELIPLREITDDVRIVDRSVATHRELELGKREVCRNEAAILHQPTLGVEVSIVVQTVVHDTEGLAQ